ncbi:MAG: endonuclease/exonuclease/phosphatase family protein [Armatimonadetes bacterium]|nr:endonuclease/exonuclease/phosphatase family protein [Armatimonadota bacterium]
MISLSLLSAWIAVQGGTTRVATYNIEWFPEDAPAERIDSLKSVLNNVKPNIIAVQEVQSLKALTQLFDSEWQIGIADETSEDQEPGIAVKKPYRLESYGLVFKDPLFDYAFPGKRDVLRAEVSTPGGKKLTFYVVHMKSRSGGRLQTAPQRTMAAGLLAAYIKGKNDENAVVLGDFNDAPDDQSLNILKSGDLNAKGGKWTGKPMLVDLLDDMYRKDAVSHGLCDLYRGQALPAVVAGAYGENERTRGIDYRYPQDLKVTQILFDQILVSPKLAEGATPMIYSGADALKGRRGRVRRNDEGRAEYTQKGTRASDHLPVYADLKIN